MHQIQRARLARGFASFPGVDGQYSRSGDSEAENLSLDLNKNSLLHAMVLSVDVLTGSDIVMVKKVEESFDINTRAAAVVPQHQIYDRSKEIEGVTDIKTKYMKKLASKLPGQSLDQIHSAKGNPKGSAKGDGEMFRVGQALSKSDEAKAKAALAWMLVPGMGALLDYCHHRTMKIGKHSFSL